MNISQTCPKTNMPCAMRPDCDQCVVKQQHTHQFTFTDTYLRDYLLSHESDIAHGINDYGLLEDTFRRVIGREPDTDKPWKP